MSFKSSLYVIVIAASISFGASISTLANAQKIVDNSVPTELPAGVMQPVNPNVAAEIAKVQNSIELDTEGKVGSFVFNGQSFMPTYLDGYVTGYIVNGKRFFLSLSNDSESSYLVLRNGKKKIQMIAPLKDFSIQPFMFSANAKIAIESEFNISQVKELASKARYGTDVIIQNSFCDPDYNNCGGGEDGGGGPGHSDTFKPSYPYPGCQDACDSDRDRGIDGCDLMGGAGGTVATGIVTYGCVASAGTVCGPAVIVGGIVGLSTAVGVYLCKSDVRSIHGRCSDRCR
jgi:hypothetical protein